MPYVMAGFPSLLESVETGRRLALAGAAAIEIGIPFSDPLADGPVIQRAGQAALSDGVTLSACLDVAGRIAAEGPPVVLMGYVNPILAHGVERFARDAAAAGVSGLIVPDLPPDEAEEVGGAIRSEGIDMVYLVAPTSTPARLRRCCEAASGFVYCVTVTGITGARTDLPPGIDDLLARVRAVSELPVAAGFGISRAEHMRALRGQADAAVVASALLREIEEGRDPLRLAEELLAACR